MTLGWIQKGLKEISNMGPTANQAVPKETSAEMETRTLHSCGAEG